ncbi:MAG: hypothetical protein IJU10_00290 [Clostridia bacterium]|nr:hypothetical protein [Clostridia bacterium]
MIYEQAARLTEIVRKDDVKAFGEIASPDLFASAFGRFPLLSFLYLFSARRIVKKYLPELIKERPRTRYERIAEADALFVKKAGKALRHYADREVSPLEMLAILGRGRELKKLFAVYPAADRYLNAIHTVYYTRLGEGVVRKGDALILPKEPLSYLQKRLLRIASMVLSVLFLLTVALSVLVPTYFGLGTAKSPYAIRNGDDFKEHIASKEAVLSLRNDMTLSETAETVGAEILGNDKIIRLTAPFADTFTGVLRDVTFVLEKGYPAAAIIKTNRGKLENVSVVTADATYDKSDFIETLTPSEGEETEETATKVFSLFATRNEGIIESCTAVVTLHFVGKEGGNCYFASFVAENYGTIRDCRAQGSASSVAVDMAGIVAVNAAAGAVMDSGADVTLTQRTTIEKWNPNVAGIAAENEGVISGCENSGKLTSAIELASLGENVSPAGAYVGGIVAVNVGSVVGCTNKGVLLATAENGFAFAGGIAARNTYNNDGSRYGSIGSSSSLADITATSSTSNVFAGGIAARNEEDCVIDGCRFTAKVSVEAPAQTEKNMNVFAAAGGICGYTLGRINASFSTGTTCEMSANRYVGAICGLAHLYLSFYSYATFLSSNAYLAGEGESYAIGALVFNGSIVRPMDLTTESDLAFLDSGTTRVSTLEELKEMDIYFE